MTHACCPDCRVRFTRAAAAQLLACPSCGRAPLDAVSAADLLGYRLLNAAQSAPEAAARAVAVSPGVEPPRTRPS
jgi:hypothetical protein